MHKLSGTLRLAAGAKSSPHSTITDVPSPLSPLLGTHVVSVTLIHMSFTVTIETSASDISWESTPASITSSQGPSWDGPRRLSTPSHNVSISIDFTTGAFFGLCMQHLSIPAIATLLQVCPFFTPLRYTWVHWRFASLCFIVVVFSYFTDHTYILCNPLSIDSTWMYIFTAGRSCHQP